MANTHKHFLNYRAKLNLSNTTFNSLKTAQSSVQKQLEKYFASKPNYQVRQFKVQGSKSINTLIRKQGDTVDIDFGIYFYPKPNVQPATLIEQVYKALYGMRHTYAPIRKNKCVRVSYNDASKIHIDVPIFYLEKLRGERNPQLATRDRWVESDATEFENWYKGKRKGNTQLTQIIRYLKGWADSQSVEMPTGVAMTVLASKYFCSHERDDIAFLETLKAINDALKDDFICLMPAKPYDDLLRKITVGKKRNDFFERLKAIIHDGDYAVKIKNEDIAYQKWKIHLGKHF